MIPVAGAVLLLLASGAPQDPLRTIVPPAPARELSVPIGEAAALELIESLLQDAGILYSIEASPGGTEPRPGAPSASSTRHSLAGLPLREALDLIVRHVPSLEWSPGNRRVNIRSLATRHADDLLQRQVSVQVSGATVRDALEALAKAMAPEVRWGIAEFGTQVQLAKSGGVTIGRAGAAPASAKSITVSAGGSVAVVLDAIADAYGPLSWRVDYEGSSATPGNARIRFVTPDRSWVALPAPDADGARVRLPVSGHLGLTLQAYTSRTGTRVHFESLMEAPPPRPATGLNPLDVTGLSHAEVLTRIVGLDPRYEWVPLGDGYLVRPHVGSRTGDTPLDAVTGALTAEDEPLERVLEEVTARLGGRLSGSGFGGGEDAEARAKRRTVTVRSAGGTVRDVLNTLAEAANMSWRVTYLPQRSGDLIVQLHLDGPEFGIMRSVRLEAGGR